MRTSSIIAMLLFVLLADQAGAQLVRYEYDVGAGSFVCPDGSDADKVPCTTAIRPGTTMSVQFCGVPAEVFTLKVTQRKLPGYEVQKAASDQILGKWLNGSPTKAPGQPVTRHQTVGDKDQVIAAFRSLQEAVDAMLGSLSMTSNFSRFEGAHLRMAARFGELLEIAGAADTPGLIKHMQQPEILGSLDMQSAAVSDYLKNVDALRQGSGTLGCSSRYAFDVDDPFDIEIEWSATNPLIKKVPDKTIVPVRFPSWKVITTTGIAVSGLVDDHFTTRSVQVTPASGSTSAVTKTIGVREDRDRFTPEVAMFLHVTPTDPSRISTGWPKQISIGGGLSGGVSGRVYLGGSWPLGRVASMTLGLAGGKVKRRSQNVDMTNLGPVDPEAARREVFKPSWFFAMSWKVGAN